MGSGRTAYIHVGRSKTGSTTIQYLVDDSRELLARHGIDVPGIGFSNRQHLHLAEALRWPKRDTSRILLAEFSRYLDENTKSFIISSEFLIAISDGAKQNLKRLLGGYNINILIYIREYADYLVSAYNHLSKKGKNTQSFDDFYADFRSNLSAYGVVESWAEACGWQAVRVRSLDSASLDGGDLSIDFLSALSIDEAPAEVAEQRANSSVDWMVAEFNRAVLERFGAAGEPDGWLRVKPFSKRLSVLTAGSPIAKARAQYLTPAQWEDLRALYDRDVAAINAHSGGKPIPFSRPREVAERPFLPAIEAIPSEILVALRRKVEGGKRLRAADPRAHDLVCEVLAAVDKSAGVELVPSS